MTALPLFAREITNFRSPSTVLFIVYGSFGSREFYCQSVRQKVGTVLQLLEKFWNWNYRLPKSLSLVTRSERDKHDFNIKYSYINSSLTTYIVLDDRHDQTKEKGTDMQFLVNESLQIRPHKELKVYRLVTRFLSALLELECLITRQITGR